jgi:hypothetical protein
MLSKGFQTLPILGIYGAMSRDNYQIETAKHCLVQSKTFTDQSLNAISINRTGTSFFRNRQTESSTTKLVGPGKYQKKSI